MKVLTIAQKASLEAVIDEWINENCEDIDAWWPEHAGKRFVTIIDEVLSYSQSAGQAQDA